MMVRRIRRLLQIACLATVAIYLSFLTWTALLRVEDDRPIAVSTEAPVPVPAPVPAEATAAAQLSSKAIWNLDSLSDRFVDWPPVCDTRQRLLILVTSAPHNFDRRQAIRETWGSVAVNKASDSTLMHSRTVFLVGRPPTDVVAFLLDSEMTRYADVLLGDYVDTYRNLTLKVIHGLLFAEQACGTSVKYVLKTDDDCFVNVRLLVNFLFPKNTVGKHQRLYVGRVQRDSRVIRSPQSKWYVPSELFVPDTYPQYASGIGYVISADLLKSLLEAATRLAPFPNEDAYVGVLMSTTRVTPIHSARFVVHGYSLLRPCNYLYVMVVHRVLTVAQQRRLVAFVTDAFLKCRPDHDGHNDDRTEIRGLDDVLLTSWR